MTRRVALLRAVNVGGHTIRMSDLRAAFESLGFDGVETFIASGNVVFEAPEADEEKLELRIERSLEAAFGYPVETFVRSLPELAQVARTDPFSKTRPDRKGHSMHVAFLDRRPTSEATRRLLDQATPDDAFAVVGREAYWLRHGGIGTSAFSGGRLEKLLGMPATLRGMSTVARLVAKYGG
jgi:uncharacterized protein (DUF1697 family)